MPLEACEVPIAQLGIIGDRRTAALSGPDGTIDWLCLPDFGSAPVFGRLLDRRRGGFWRLGPQKAACGRRAYLGRSWILTTTWTDAATELELTDALLLPSTIRPSRGETRRGLLRRLRCRRGISSCTMALYPRDDFGAPAAVSPLANGMTLKIGKRRLGLWVSAPVTVEPGGVTALFELEEGDEFWVVMGLEESFEAWSVAEADAALRATIAHWESRAGRYSGPGPRGDELVRSALLIELLSFAPTGAAVAAPTTSLPERIGGDRNYDYRYAWVRDASIALATLSVLGDTEAAERYMGWLARLGSSSAMPVQVLYRATGEADIGERTRDDLSGYGDSLPVRYGNRAFRQVQSDALGYLADCAAIYLHQGGRWQRDYWELVKRLADYTVRHWRRPGNGIWELPQERHFVSSKVMSWATLNRALYFADRSGATANLRLWRDTMTEIHEDVMEHGWSDRLQSFRQDYEADRLDASALLIPLMGFLDPHHPRVAATVECIEQHLMRDGLVYRCPPEGLDPTAALPLGAFEGAFLPCCFWLASVYAMMGRRSDAEAMLRRLEAIAGEVGLFSEEADGATKSALGNTPMIFSHGEYARAILHLEGAWPRDL